MDFDARSAPLIILHKLENTIAQLTHQDVTLSDYERAFELIVEGKQI